MSYHTLIVVGNLGRDPEMRYTPSGEAVTNFSVAVDNSYTEKSSGNKVERTIWVRVSTWGKQAENCMQYLKKGKKVLVEGHLSADAATGGPKTFERRDGTVGAAYEMSAMTVRFLSPRGEDTGGAPSEPDTEVAAGTSDSSDIPF